MLNDELLLAPAAGQAPLAEVKNGVVQTALLIIANCAGAGILSLPKAMNQSSLVAGSILVVCAAILSAYTADILGRCYSLTEQRKKGAQIVDALEDTREDVTEKSYFARSPYAAIGWKAAGPFGAAAVTVAQVLTQFSVLVLFFLISGINLNKLIPQRSSLFFSLVCTAALTPLMLLRPGHVWGTAILAILASVILVVVVIILCTTGAPHDPYMPPPTVTFSTFGSAFGVILFGFGGHAILPALQATLHDATPTRFRQAVVGSFAVCTAMYLASSISSVRTLGGAVGSDILTNFSGPIDSFGLVAVTVHLLFAAVTVHIPLGQIMDHYLGATDFSARQVGIRVVTMSGVALLIWAIGGHFFCVMGLVGGTCNNAMIFIFPPLFYLKLLPLLERTPATMTRMVAITAVGTAGMVSALVGAVDTCRSE